MTDINLKDKLGYTPLIVAILNDDYEMVDLLLKNGADPNIKIEAGVYKKSPLYLAKNTTYYKDKQRNREKIVNLLLDYGAEE